MVRILENDRLGRLVHTDSWNEPVLRRTVIDKSAKRTRYLLSSVDWDPKLIQWLHVILIDHLNATYLAGYLDILQVISVLILCRIRNDWILFFLDIKIEVSNIN